MSVAVVGLTVTEIAGAVEPHPAKKVIVVNAARTHVQRRGNVMRGLSGESQSKSIQAQFLFLWFAENHNTEEPCNAQQIIKYF